jgi:hypothetical protein
MTSSEASIAAQLLGSIKSVKKQRASRQNAQRVHQALLRKNARPFAMREISRIEKQADRSTWWEILSCGHRARQAQGPNRMYLAGFDGPARVRRCYECRSEKS